MNSSNNLKNPSYFIPDPWTDTKSDSSFFQNYYTSFKKTQLIIIHQVILK